MERLEESDRLIQHLLNITDGLIKDIGKILDLAKHLPECSAQFEILTVVADDLITLLHLTNCSLGIATKRFSADIKALE